MAKKTKSGKKFSYKVRKGAAKQFFSVQGIRKFVAGIGRKLNFF